MGDSPEQVRSYQRIFKPDRRIYQIDGRRLPVPGGVPLNWLCWAAGSLLVILVLSSRSLLLSFGAAGFAALVAGAARGLRSAAVAGPAAAFVIQLTGLLLGWVDWPLRFVVAPMLIATAAGQLSPDGRTAHRYLISRLALWLRVKRRSLARPLMVDGRECEWAPRVWIAPDEYSAVLAHGRVTGPARVVFGQRVVLTPRRGRHVVRPVEGHRMRPRDIRAEVVELGDGQILEIRP